MRTNELRIGNIIDVGSDEVIDVVTGIGNDEITCKHCKIKAEYAEGVKLNRKWLVDFGFDLWGNVYMNEYESYERWVLFNVVGGSSNFEVHIITSSYGRIPLLSERPEDEIAYSVDNDERQYIHENNYVHNLQNAYFNITGNELEHSNPYFNQKQ
jgi:hypothetical protein